MCYDKNMNCLLCGQPFEPKRKTAKFCTNKCRIYYSRNIKVNKKDLDNLDSVTPKPLSVTDSVTKKVVSVTKPVSVTDSVTTPVALIRQPIPKTLVVNKKAKKYMGVFGICPKHHGSSYFTCGCTPPAKE
jgi:hypothetical protein